MEAGSVGTWKPCTPYLERPIARHDINIHAEVSRVYETNRWNQLPGVGHTGASDKNIRAPKTPGKSVPVVTSGRTGVKAQGERVDQEGGI